MSTPLHDVVEATDPDERVRVIGPMPSQPAAATSAPETAASAPPPVRMEAAGDGPVAREAGSGMEAYAGGGAVPVPRVERMLAIAVAHIAQLEDRMVALERQLHEAEERMADLPDHGDVLEVRLHSARVSSEMTRLAVELRAEIAEIKEESDRAAGGRALDVTRSTGT